MERPRGRSWFEAGQGAGQGAPHGIKHNRRRAVSARAGAAAGVPEPRQPQRATRRPATLPIACSQGKPTDGSRWQAGNTRQRAAAGETATARGGRRRRRRQGRAAHRPAVPREGQRANAGDPTAAPKGFKGQFCCHAARWRSGLGVGASAPRLCPARWIPTAADQPNAGP